MSATAGLLLIGVCVGIAGLALGIWIVRMASRRIREWRFGHPIRTDILMREYGRRISGANDAAALTRILAVELPGILHLPRAALLLPAAHQLADAAAGLQIPISHPAVRWVASSGEAHSAARGRLSGILRQGRTDWSWAAAWVPLMRGAELRGLWLLGVREGGAGYSPEDLACLTDVGRQSAVFLDTIRSAEQERRSADELRTLYRRVVSAQEVERGRLARDLHDGVLQDLCAVSRDLKTLHAAAGPDPAAAADLAARSDAAVQSLRAICHGLRPPLLRHDLGAALKALALQWEGRSRAVLQVEITCERPDLPDEAAIAVFRVAQEALQNAVRHADASEIMLRLTGYPDSLRLTVTDDGRGIPGGTEVADGHFGLAGMRERAAMIGGKLEIQSAANYGTVVILEIPNRGLI